MDIKDLAMVRAIATHRSITAAAEQLNTVQSNVTGRIRQLEERLQVRLFRRHARGVIPTEAGEKLLVYADRILALANEATKVMHQTAGLELSLRIGSNESTAALRLASILADYCRQYPKINLSVSTGVTKDLIGQVLANEIDGALIIGPIKHRDLEAETVGVEEVVLITPPSELSLRGRPTMLTFRKGCGYRRILEAFLQQQGIEWDKILEIGTVEGILRGVNAGLGISLLAKTAIDSMQSQCAVHCTRLPAPYCEAPVQFIRRRDTLTLTTMRSFVAAARRHFIATTSTPAAQAAAERAS